MTTFIGTLSARKIRNKQEYRARLTIRREALGEAVHYDFKCSSVQAVNRHALYLMACDVSNVDGLGLQSDLDAARLKTYSDVYNVLEGMARRITRTAYRGDVLDVMYFIDNLINTRPDTSPLTRAQCMEYCGKVSAYNRKHATGQKAFIYHVYGGTVREAYADGKRVYTMADVYALHGSV